MQPLKVESREAYTGGGGHTHNSNKGGFIATDEGARRVF